MGILPFWKHVELLLFVWFLKNKKHCKEIIEIDFFIQIINQAEAPKEGLAYFY